MRTKVKSVMMLTILFATMVYFTVSASAAEKGYSINTGNTRVYSNTGCTNGYGWIYDSDEVIINQITNNYMKVTYPVSKGTKTGYVKTSAFLTKTASWISYSRGKITTYKRPNGGTYGYIAKGDKVYIYTWSKGFLQIKYPVSGGWKYAFIRETDYNNYLKPVPTPTPIPSNGAISVNKPITSFNQTDSRWKNVRYGYSDKSCKTPAYLGKGASGNVGSGCGVLALTNAVYYLTGKFIQPSEIASYSLKYGYRVNGVGTAYGLYKSFASNRGSGYGFKWIGQTSNWATLKSYLTTGKVAICGKSGHIMALVNYNKSTNKYLLLDSCPSKNRGTYGSGYVWATESYLKNTVGIRSDFYVLGLK